MKHTDRKPERFKRVLPLAALLLLAGALQAAPVFAEEPATTPTAPAAANQWKEKRQEKMQTFFDKHPDLKTKLDANADGTVDKTEFKQARETRQNEFQEKRQEKRQDFLEKHPNLKEKMDANQDGTVDKNEFKQSRQEFKEKRGNQYGRDRDNNPPGKAGGPGTNWENRPGKAGGPGASPDKGRHYANGHRDRDNNPPGKAGGRGTNWENRPGPAGGAGASPDKKGGGWGWGKKK